MDLSNGFCSQEGKKTFKWPVEVKEPSATKPGKFEKSEFTAIFKRVKLSELEGVTESEGASLLKKVLVVGKVSKTRTVTILNSLKLSLMTSLMTWIG